MNKSIILSLLLMGSSYTYSQSTDPVLAAAVVSGDGMVTTQLDNINDNQKSIASLQALIYTNINIVRDYEKKTYDYLANASVAIKNMQEIIRAAELTREISTNLVNCADAAGRHPKGAIISSIVSKTSIKVTSEVISLYSYIASLVTKGDDNSSEKAINLLNSAERSNITWTVLQKLNTINFQCLALRWEIEYMTLSYIPIAIAPQEYFMAIDGKRIANDIISSFSK